MSFKLKTRGGQAPFRGLAPFGFSLLIFSFAFTWPGQKAQEETKSEAAEPQASSGAGPRVVPVIPKVPKVVKPPAAIEGIVKPPAVDTHIAEIREQIESIVKLNESLKTRHREQAAEIQRITEQSQIHQRILRDLEAARKARKAASVVDTAAILEAEKVKLIREETKKNQEFIQSLEKGKEGKPAA